MEIGVDKPEIHVKKTWVHAHPGIRAKLDCTVIAWPEAKVSPSSRLLMRRAIAALLINNSNNN